MLQSLFEMQFGNIMPAMAYYTDVLLLRKLAILDNLNIRPTDHDENYKHK